MLRVKHDGRIDEWIRRFGEAPPKMMTTMSRLQAEEAIGLIADGWKKQADPYGRPWKPKKRPDGRAILVRSGRLRNSWHVVRSTSRYWIVASSVKYAGAHQNPRRRKGWGKRPGSLKRLPQRMMVPSKSKGLPRDWAAAYVDNAREAFLKHFTSSAGGSRSLGFTQGKLIGLKRRFSAQAVIRRAFRAISGD